MKRFHALVIVLSLGTSGLLANVRRMEMPPESLEAQFAADGAFRDGLYVGRLTAESGRESRPNVGRWSLLALAVRRWMVRETARSTSGQGKPNVRSCSSWNRGSEN